METPIFYPDLESVKNFMCRYVVMLRVISQAVYANLTLRSITSKLYFRKKLM